jgi:8-oxo-dGTP diphosphatase
MKPVKDLNIVIGICERDGKYLLLQRKDSNPMWDKKWEFPGGKIEIGEDSSSAINREILEETGLEVSKSVFFHHHTHDWDLEESILRVHIDCFHCLVGDGEVVAEQDKSYQTRWVTRQEALEMDSLKANNDILNTFFHEVIQNLG